MEISGHLYVGFIPELDEYGNKINPETGEILEESSTYTLAKELAQSGNYDLIENQDGSFTIQQKNIEESEKITNDVTSNALTSNENNLVSQMKAKNDLLKNQNDLVKKQNDIFVDIANKIEQQNKNMMAIVDSNLSIGKAIVDQTQKQNFHNEFQTTVNSLLTQKEVFLNHGVLPDGSTLTDTEGNQIIPIVGKAVKDQEQSIDITKENKIDYSVIFDDETQEENNNQSIHPDNIMGVVVSSMVNDIDATKIDNGGTQ